MARRPATHKASGPAPRAGNSAVEGPLVKIDVRSLELHSGGARRVDGSVHVDALRCGGQDYHVEPATIDVQCEVVRLINGWHLRLRTQADLRGPCWRCLGDAHLHSTIDVTEIAIQGAEDPDMECLYLVDDVLEIADWVRDAIAEDLPSMILCDEGCAGLCPICGENRNVVRCECARPDTDPRWSALAELAQRLEIESADDDNVSDSAVDVGED